MAVRKIIRIDEEKCNGCGQCIVNCPEGALRIVDGKARLVRESYCDGLGACLGTCPLGAITIEDRQAEPFDEAAVVAHLAVIPANAAPRSATPDSAAPEAAAPDAAGSQLTHWPVEWPLISPAAPFLQGADLLLAADCVPVAMADFHARLLSGRAVVLGCPKLDRQDAMLDKLQAIFVQAGLRSLTIVHMEVPCCHGLSHLARAAMQGAGCHIPAREITVSRQGEVLSEVNW